MFDCRFCDSQRVRELGGMTMKVRVITRVLVLAGPSKGSLMYPLPMR